MIIKSNQHLAKQFQQQLNIITFMKEECIAGLLYRAALALARLGEP